MFIYKLVAIWLVRDWEKMRKDKYMFVKDKILQTVKSQSNGNNRIRIENKEKMRKRTAQACKMTGA